MTLKTVLNKVIVEPVEAETVTKGGIQLLLSPVKIKVSKVQLSQLVKVKQTNRWK